VEKGVLTGWGQKAAAEAMVQARMVLNCEKLCQYGDDRMLSMAALLRRARTLAALGIATYHDFEDL